MPITGDYVETDGTYCCTYCGQQVDVVEGGDFPECPNEMKATTWKELATVLAGVRRVLGDVGQQAARPDRREGGRPPVP